MIRTLTLASGLLLTLAAPTIAQDVVTEANPTGSTQLEQSGLTKLFVQKNLSRSGKFRIMTL